MEEQKQTQEGQVKSEKAEKKAYEQELVEKGYAQYFAASKSEDLGENPETGNVGIGFKDAVGKKFSVVMLPKDTWVLTAQAILKRYGK